MREPSGLNTLAETLAKSGLAASTTEAMRMAQSILGTERRVASTFDEKNQKIDQSLSKKTYQEEIDELIEKTSPEKKDFHYMVSGYKEAVHRDKKQEVFHELEEQAVREADNQEEVLSNSLANKEVEDLLDNPVEEEEEQGFEETPGQVDIFSNAPSSENTAQVYTDSLSDDRPLKDLFIGQAEESLNIASEDKPEYNVISIAEPDEKSPTPAMAEDEFIVPAPEGVMANKVLKEVAQPKREFKNPIPEVNLMDHFRFG